MKLTAVDNSSLVENLLRLARDERSILTLVLHHLREVDRRRLFADLGYKSLFDFTVRHLGYPEDQAYRRISAMRLLRDIPEIEEKIASGDLNLSHIGLAQSLFRQEKRLGTPVSRETKLEVCEQIAKKPFREAELITLAMSSSPQLAKPDRINQITCDFVELRFTAPAHTLEKVERLKGRLAHRHPNLSLGKLLDILCDLGLEEWSREKTATSRKRCVTKPSQAEIVRSVFRAAGSKCENCGSMFALEVDHIEPRAKGGSSNAENLRLLCRSCNQRAAIKQFGQQAMDPFLT